MKALEFDREFDDGEGVLDYLDLAGARRVEQEQKRVEVDLSVWMIRSLDREARRLGIPRQSLIRMVIAEHVEEARAR